MFYMVLVLGLSIVKNLVTQMEWRGFVISESGKGSLFSVVLPLEKVNNPSFEYDRK